VKTRLLRELNFIVTLFFSSVSRFFDDSTLFADE
jgi:hypothetical protein